MMNLDKLLESLFCKQFQEQIIEHINTCSTCQNGVLALYDQLPVLKMIPGLDKKVKGMVKHGNSAQSGKSPA
jgi:hypothetical protein